jgi:hypothetical protein
MSKNKYKWVRASQAIISVTPAAHIPLRNAMPKRLHVEINISDQLKPFFAFFGIAQVYSIENTHPQQHQDREWEEKTCYY